MSTRHQGAHGFTVQSTDDVDSEFLVAGFSEYGLAGLTAVDYLVDQFGLRPVGHVETSTVPTVTPFEEGRPRHPIRVLTNDEVPFAVLLSELLVPVTAADAFGDALYDWCDANGVEEVVVLSGVSIQHAPTDHRTFFVATDDFRARRLDGTDVPPMGTGYLDGVSGSLVAGGIDSPRAVCVFVTPAHPQAPDAEAALRLVETLSSVYDLGVDTGPLEAFADDVESHYRELAERMEAAREELVPEDRMYM